MSERGTTERLKHMNAECGIADQSGPMTGLPSSDGRKHRSLFLFNYPWDNPEAKEMQAANAALIKGVLTLLVPRNPHGNYPAVEVVHGEFDYDEAK